MITSVKKAKTSMSRAAKMRKAVKKIKGKKI